MGALVLAVWVYMFVQHMVEEAGGRNFPVVAYKSIWEYGIVATVFLVAPFIGACSGLRLVRSGERPGVVIGWLMLAAFSLFFFMSCVIYWSDYHRYASTP
jgi:hypothetical protein